MISLTVYYYTYLTIWVDTKTNVKTLSANLPLQGEAQPVAQRGADQLVDADGLLHELFKADCRPSERWLRKLRAQRIIPYHPIGRLIFYDVAEVRDALANRCTVRARA